MLTSHLLPLTLLPLLTSAHFQLNYPPARGFDEDKLTIFPCAGWPVSSTRTPWPITGGSIELVMGHDQSLLQVLLGLGNDVGDAFNYVLLPTVTQQGLGDFCVQGLKVPGGLNVTDGMNATIQVVTSGDPDGGLYNCADITFHTTINTATIPPCKNQTGATAIAYTGPYKNANQTGSSSSSSSNSSASGTGTGTASASSTPSATKGSGAGKVAAGLLGVVAGLGAVVLF